jgi:hypothetical protein
MDPNVTVQPYPQAPSTSLEVYWSFPDGDPPEAVSVNLFDVGGTQLQASDEVFMPEEGPVYFPGLQPGTTYYVQFCTYYGESGPDCSAWNMYSGTTAAGSPPPPPPPGITPNLLIVSIRPYPNHLEKSGGEWQLLPAGAAVRWTAAIPAFILAYRLNSADTDKPVLTKPITSDTAAAQSGTVTINPPTPGASYVLNLAGSPTYDPAESGQEFWSENPAENSIQPIFTTATNSNSLKAFLTASGVTGSNGIKQFFPPMTSISLRTYMGI